MKRLAKLTTGNSSIDMSRVIDGVRRFRISMFEFTGSSSVETIHLKIDNDSGNFDETTDMYYSLFFLSHINSSIIYTPAMQSEGWFDTRDLHNISVQLFINGVLAGDIASRNCWLEICYE